MYVPPVSRKLLAFFPLPFFGFLVFVDPPGRKKPGINCNYSSKLHELKLLVFLCSKLYQNSGVTYVENYLGTVMLRTIKESLHFVRFVTFRFVTYRLLRFVLLRFVLLPFALLPFVLLRFVAIRFVCYVTFRDVPLGLLFVHGWLTTSRRLLGECGDFDWVGRWVSCSLFPI